MTGEVLALLTPENLAAMGTLTSVWMGSQGVPGVGQAVDAALLTIGVVLTAAQAADLSRALWEYAKKSHGAQKKDDLEAAADHLAHAIALAGVNVVTLILTKKVAGRVERSPPAGPPPRPATPPGTPPAGTPGQVSRPLPAHMVADGNGSARSLYRMARVEAWRKPKFTEDGRILPHEGTRKPPQPIPNLGRNRAGQVVTRGKHTVRFDKDGFPVFETQFETLLQDIHIGSGNRIAHFKAANQKLFEAIQEDAGLARTLGLSEETISRLPSLSKAPEGYSWHHHQDVGRMQLVQGDAHRLSIPHTGGMAIWGGGQ
ncbi:HNH endonuclease [Archangium sp.]|uniref:HNH endonuclease n=1 Tax=Archangium sp. TaxID=1872627 RepID=UPI002D4A482C|nr:HNH endonuclease [Archangium sp.]HYO55623.1 HNH endonuclease [Archangium sp.]